MGQDKGNRLYVQILYCPVDGLSGVDLSVCLVVLIVFLSVRVRLCVCFYLFIDLPKMHCPIMLCPDFVLDVYTTQYIAPQYIIKKNTNLMCVNCPCSGAVFLCLVTER